MDVKSLLVYHGELKAIAVSSLEPEHYVLAAFVTIDGKERIFHRSVSEGTLKVDTPIGVLDMTDRPVDKTVTRFAMFCAINAERVVYPEEANGVHAIDAGRFVSYMQEVLREIVNSMHTEAGPADEFTAEAAAFHLMEVWPLISDMRYITAHEYRGFVNRMVDNLIEKFDADHIRDVSLLISEDTRDAGNMIAVACWTRIEPYIGCVLVLDERGRLTDASLARARKKGRNYLAFTDASLDGTTMLAIHSEIKVFESAVRGDAKFKLFFAAPIVSYNAFRAEIRALGSMPTTENLFTIQGTFIQRAPGQGEIDRDDDEETGILYLLKRVTGWTPNTTRLYSDFFVTHPENDTSFLIGYYNSASTSRPSRMKRPTIIDNYKRDEELLRFASSIEYMMPKGRTGELEHTMNMSDVIFTR